MTDLLIDIARTLVLVPAFTALACFMFAPPPRDK